MTLFQNGRRFPVAIECLPPLACAVPIVDVEMAWLPGAFKTVTGKVDTGALRTMLTFGTAVALGIQDPAQSPLSSCSAESATGDPIPYYVHHVSVMITDGASQRILFPLDAAFSDRISRNLFGMDWLAHFCLAVDIQAVHFLRGRVAGSRRRPFDPCFFPKRRLTGGPRFSL